MQTATAVPTKGKVIPIKESKSGADLASKTVYLKIRFGMLGNSRRISNSNVEVDADKALIQVNKTLLDSDELDAIRQLDNDMRMYLYNICLPFDMAMYILPLTLVETVDDKIKEFEKERKKLVEEFLRAYPTLCQEAAVRLRGVFNPGDYPNVDYVRSRFTFRYQYVSFGVPGQLKAISDTIFRNEREKAEKVMKEAEETVTQVMRETLAEMVNHLAKSLEMKDDGKPRKLYDTTVEKLKDFLSTFDLRNVMDDVELKKKVEQAKALIAGVSTEELRTTEGVRLKVRQGMEKIGTELATLVETKPTRKFRFDGD